MNRSELITQIYTKKSFLCVGLDAETAKLPKHFSKNAEGMLSFNKQIIDATREFCVAYKPNTAFYEAMGADGWDVLAETVAYIGKEHFIIADAKRGDIGNTANRYANAFFNQLQADAVTVSPYMGYDSVTPFLEFQNKWAIVLALTSNPGANDFELQKIDNRYLFELVLSKAATWGTLDNLMFVIGATRPEMLKLVRNIVPNHFLLIPGVGAQGGSLEEVCRFGLTKEIGVLINASRSVIYASSNTDFAEAAGKEAESMANAMKKYF